MSKRMIVLQLALLLAFYPASVPEAAERIEYKPPPRGAPARRVGGATRAPDRLAGLTVLAPDHVALTASEQPTLYWFLPEKSEVRVEVALVDSKGVKPLLETSYSNLERGIHAVSLKDFNVRLTRNEEYQWSVALVMSDKQRSRDIVSQASLRLVEVSNETRASIAKRPQHEQAIEYAAMGIWHDALQALSASISAFPDRHELRDMRAALLEQAGLKAAANFDRRASR